MTRCPSGLVFDGFMIVALGGCFSVSVWYRHRARKSETIPRGREGAAAVLGRTILSGRRTPLLMEMPPYRMPHFPSLMRMMWERSAVFVTE